MKNIQHYNNLPKDGIMSRLYRKKWLIAIISLFLLGNIILYNHAYQFTHFSSSTTQNTKKPIEQLTWLQKVTTIFNGVRIPKPTNTRLPLLPYETIYLEGEETLETWWIPQANSKGIVLLFHGYAGSKSGLLAYSETFAIMGYSTLLVDFRGSGGSTGNTTTIGFKEANDVVLAYKYCKEQFPNQSITLFGFSMGSAAIMKAVADKTIQPNKIILECPFESMLATTRKRFEALNAPSFPFAEFLLFYGGWQTGFDAFAHQPVEYAKQITCPTLLQYGAKDKRVNRSEIDNIYANLKGIKQLTVFEQAGHEIYLSDHHADWEKAVKAFLN